MNEKLKNTFSIWRNILPYLWTWNPKSRLPASVHNHIWRFYIKVAKMDFYGTVNSRHEVLDKKLGGSKSVLKVSVKSKSGQEYYAYFLLFATAFKKRTLQDKWFDNIKLSKQWYRYAFKDFVNKENIIRSHKNPFFAVGVQKWIEYDEKISFLFSNINKYEKEIIAEAKLNPKFKQEVLKFFKKVLEVFECTGQVPDLFNDTHPNIV